MMRVVRPVQYVAYVVAISVLHAMVVLTGLVSSLDGEPGDPRDAMAFLPMALAMAPYAVLQVVVAALVIKPLSLWKLFGVSAAFLLGGVVLAGPASQCSWPVIRHIGLWVYTIALGNFGLLIPVLILALIGRRRAGRLVTASSVPASGDLPDKLPTPQAHNGVSGSGWRWYYWDIGLAVVVLWLGAMIDPWGMLSYLGGLINVPFPLEALMLSVVLVPGALLCPVILLVRMLVTWPRRLRSWRGLLSAWGIAIGAFLVGFILPILLPIARPWDAFMAGFQRYVQRRVDIPAVQEWLAKVKPEPLEPGQAHPNIRVQESDLPASIAGLKAWGWRMESDDAGRARIWLTWGSGVMGGWGLVVGDEQMETPPSDFSQYGEVRQTIAPGAYVWYDVK